MKDLIEGEIFLKARKWKEAFDFFSNLDLTNESLEDISYIKCSIAQCYVGMDNLSEAINLYNDVINSFPIYRRPYFELGLLYEKNRMYSSEISILERALKTTKRTSCKEREDSWNKNFFLHLTFALFQTGSYEKAAGYIAIASLLFPTENFENELEMCKNAWKSSLGT